jgi:hypothetical protein
VPKNIPETIDSMRENHNMMLPGLGEESQMDLNLKFERDELISYFQKAYEPKILITFSDNPQQVSFYSVINLSHFCSIECSA